MIKINDNDYAEIERRISEGLISRKEHDKYDYEILNYTKKCQYTRSWDDYTRICRGLILTSHHEVIAKPFPKFFNLDEIEETKQENLPKEIPCCTEKLDGVLGILYPNDDAVAIASRGSFNSDYAIWATQWLRAKGYSLNDFRQGYTYCFEIISPISKQVVDYEDRAELVLLAVINNADQRELAPSVEANELGLPFAKEYLWDIEDAKNYLSTAIGTDEEGFVFRYLSNNLRVKLKAKDYIRLHKLLTGLTPRKIWDVLKAEQSVTTILELIPDEFYSNVRETAQELQQQKKKLMDEANRIFQLVNKKQDRKEQAIYIISQTETNKTLRGIVFNLLNENVVKAEEAAWLAVKP